MDLHTPSLCSVPLGNVTSPDTFVLRKNTEYGEPIYLKRGVSCVPELLSYGKRLLFIVVNTMII